MMFLQSTFIALLFPLALGLFGSKKKSPTDQLYLAIYKDDATGAQAALDAGADVNGGRAERGDYGYKHRTPLDTACVMKNTEIIKLLLARGADVNARSGQLAGVTPLEVAVGPAPEEHTSVTKPEDRARIAQRRLATVKLLIEKGADVKRGSRLGSNAITAAAANGELEIVELLIKKGAPVVGQGALDQPLLEAAKSRKSSAPKIAEALISHGAKPTIQFPPNGETALQVASARGNLETVRVLLNRGAKVEQTDRLGTTALHAAAAGNHLEIARLLLSHHANAKAADANNHTPRDLARGEEMRELLKG